MILVASFDLIESVDIMVVGSVYDKTPFTAFIHRANTANKDQSFAKIGEITAQYPGDKSNADVEVLILWDPGTKYFLFDVFHHFPATRVLQIVRPYQQMESPINGHFIGAKNLDRVFITNQQFNQMCPNVFEGAISVIWIYLEHNQIKTIDEFTFRDLRTLIKLSLQSNQIAELHNGTFQTLLDLEFVNLNNNLIRSLSPKLFVNNKKLKSVLINANRIMFIQSLEMSANFDMFQLLDNLCVQSQFHSLAELNKAVQKVCTVEISSTEVLEKFNEQQGNSDNCNAEDIETVLAFMEEINALNVEIKQYEEDKEKLTDILNVLENLQVCQRRSEYDF